MAFYQTKTPEQLTDEQIGFILQHWEVKEWLLMTAAEFRQAFKRSTFRLLTGENGTILAFARINADFAIRIGQDIYAFKELVGLVAVEKQKGHGSRLVQAISTEMKEQDCQAIGFCEKQLRVFYEKSGIPLLYDKARSIYEEQNGTWTRSTDDDIVVLNLSPEKKTLLDKLGDPEHAWLLPATNEGSHAA